jgi:hypothetical protein
MTIHAVRKFPADTKYVIIARVAISDPKLCPEFIRLANVSIDGSRYELKTLAEELTQLGPNATDDALQEIRKLYPSVSTPMLVAIWARENKISIADIPQSILDLAPSIEAEIDSIDAFQKNSRKAAQKRVAEYEQVYEELFKEAEVKTSDFELDSVNGRIVFGYSEHRTLFQVFYSMKPSPTIPIIVYMDKTSVMSKVHPELGNQPDQFFSQFSNRFLPTVVLYYMFPNNTAIPISIQGNEIIYEHMPISKKMPTPDQVHETLAASLVYKPDTWTVEQTGVHGTFKISNFTIKQAIWADLITFDPVMSFFYFLNDQEQAFLMKRRAMFYFTSSIEKSRNMSDSQSITIIDKAQDTEIRIRRASTMQEIKTIIAIFRHALGRYKRLMPKIIAEYKQMVPKFEELALGEKKQAKKALDKNTGQKVQELEIRAPEIFGEDGEYKKAVIAEKAKNPRSKIRDYSALCQREGQPRIVDQSEAKDFPANQVLLFKGKHYVCDTNNLKDGVEYKYPKIRKTNLSEMPGIPCCVTKEWKGIKKYNASGIVGNGKKEVGAHILGPNKSLLGGRVGYAALDICSFSSVDFKCPDIKSADVIREGMAESGKDQLIKEIHPSAVIIALEKVIRKNNNPDVMQIRRKLSEMDVSIAKQELFDYSADRIKNMLLDEDFYLQLDRWISLLEKYYGITIYLFQTNAQYPNGNFLLPVAAQKHLVPARRLNPDKVVLFNIFEREGEIIRKRNNTYIFSKDDLIVKRYIQVLKML